MTSTLLQVRNLNKDFQQTVAKKLFSRRVPVRVVDDITFDLEQGVTLSIVGESGCGKTTLGRCLVRGISTTSGEVLYRGDEGQKIDFLKIKGDTYRKYRKEIQMIFQDPFSSLSPRMTVFDIIAEPIANIGLTKSEIKDRVFSIAAQTGLNTHYLSRYPHAFSGGQRQRIAIARALISNPKLVVCDEAVSALDVSIQAQIINLLKDLQEQLGTTYIFISHDLSVVRNISHKVAVMHLGKFVEYAEVNKLYEHPMHPYTEALLSAVPDPNLDAKRERIILQGEVPNPANPPSGCKFHPRCIYKTEKCVNEEPDFQEIEDGHYVACHYAKDLKLRGVHSLE